MKKVIFLFSFFIAINSYFAQKSSSYEEDMKTALGIHDTASSVKSELLSLEAFEKITRIYPDEWLSNYWTAYLCTQIARLKGRDPAFPQNLDSKELIIRAQKYFDKSYNLKKNKTDSDFSDFHTLQAFIYDFSKSYVAQNENEKKIIEEKQKQEYKLAVKYNRKNPLLMVLTGINLTRENRSEREVAAGIILIEEAEEIFNKSPERSATTFWNKDFIPFWKSRASKKLETMVE